MMLSSSEAGWFSCFWHFVHLLAVLGFGEGKGSRGWGLVWSAGLNQLLLEHVRPAGTFARGGIDSRVRSIKLLIQNLLRLDSCIGGPDELWREYYTSCVPTVGTGVRGRKVRRDGRMRTK